LPLKRPDHTEVFDETPQKLVNGPICDRRLKEVCQQIGNRSDLGNGTGLRPPSLLISSL
jgi:hypothetical protein